MATITCFEEIEAWKTARQLTNAVYRLTGLGDFAKDFGLKGQIQRAAVSVMSNIAEGFESRTQSVFIDYLGRAKGSAGEVRCQLYVALDQKYITQAQFNAVKALAEKASRQIAGFISYLETKPNARRVREDVTEYSVES